MVKVNERVGGPKRTIEVFAARNLTCMFNQVGEFPQNVIGDQRLPPRIVVNQRNAAGTGTLTIATTASSSPTCTSSNQVPSGIPWYAGSGAALASLFLFVIPKRGRTWRSILGLLFMALVGGVVACSGGGGGGVACPSVVKSGTTAGTYIITVTGTSGAITKTGTVTVTVQ